MENGRHPIVEALLQTSCVPNSINLTDDVNKDVPGEEVKRDPKAVILTGPNMGGKTSTARQIALISAMAQMGCYVPADAFSISPLDGIYTRMGAHDDMMAGQSTFFVELMETSRLLARATSRYGINY